MTLKSNKIVAALRAAAQKGVDVDEALDQVTTLVESSSTVRTGKVQAVLTTIGTKHDGEPLILAWSTCDGCKHHVSRCDCPKGPTMPSYVAKWVEQHEAEINGLPTVVSTPKIAEEGLSPEGVPDSGEIGNGPTQTDSKGVPSSTRSRASCKECGKAVLTGPDNANADRNDDGSWTCFDCQEGGK